MTRCEAKKVDTCYYAEYDREFETWAVFGDNSGFCYKQCDDEESAERITDELNYNIEAA